MVLSNLDQTITRQSLRLEQDYVDYVYKAMVDRLAYD